MKREIDKTGLVLFSALAAIIALSVWLFYDLLSVRPELTPVVIGSYVVVGVLLVLCVPPGIERVRRYAARLWKGIAGNLHHKFFC